MKPLTKWILGFAAVLVVGLLVVVTQIVMSVPQAVEATVRNVFQQEIANEWRAIEQEIGQDPDYEVVDFRMEYTRLGEMHDLYWLVRKRGADGNSCTFYEITRTGQEYSIMQTAGLCDSQFYIRLDKFLKAMTSDLLRTITPQVPYDAAVLDVHPVQKSIKWESGPLIYGWDGARLQGPLDSGSGYLVDLTLLHSFGIVDIDAEHSSGQKTFFIGGQYLNGIYQ